MEASRQSAVDYLRTLVGQPLLYAIKSPDTELYDFGFGKLVEKEDHCGKQKRVGTHTLHILCRFKMIWRTEDQRIDTYYEDAPSEKFHSNVEYVKGLKVRQVALSDKNDLWLDFGDLWMVFATLETSEESWRFFIFDKELPHLVASDCWIDFVD